jgi:hypothetical protein
VSKSPKAYSDLLLNIGSVSAHQTIDVDISESVCPNDMVPFAAAGKFSPQR